MAQAWDAYRAALRAGLRDHHSDTLAFAARAFAKGTRATYLCAVRGTPQGTNNDNDVQLAIDGRLLLLGHRRQGGSVARNTVSGFQMPAKLQLIPEVVTARIWLQVRAIDKSTAHMARPRIWATSKDLERLGKCRHHWPWARTFFAAACAAVFALRVGDVGSFTWDGIATPPFLTFWDQKVNAKLQKTPTKTTPPPKKKKATPTSPRTNQQADGTAAFAADTKHKGKGKGPSKNQQGKGKK